MNKPIAVCISDIHFNLNTLSIASSALRSALKKAEELTIPLIVAGDLNDSKAIIRAEVANELISILSSARTPVYIMVGNHDLINERGNTHSLNFLKPYVNIIDSPIFNAKLNTAFFPYQTDAQLIKGYLQNISPPGILIMHQGFLGAQMGDYIQDKTSIDPSIVKDFTVISGHYHRHQTLGTVTYIGSPFTMTFGEANDGPKGFLILNEDGSFTREILNLRKHIIIESNLDTIYNQDFAEYRENPQNIIMLKLKGSFTELQTLNKQELGMKLFGHTNFKLSLIYNEAEKIDVKQTTSTNNTEILDMLIDNLNEKDLQTTYLKELYLEIISSDSK